MEWEVEIGIDSNGARFLAFAKSVGVDFTSTAMIGRQNLYVEPHEIPPLLAICGINVSEADAREICGGAGGYSEMLFHYLGAKRVHSFDYSDYEKPTYTHDMNEPIPEKFKESYAALIDGGSLEHIFNFPVAIKNCMEMVVVGGHYLAITPANNFFGHGFYQFSPELYYSVFSEDNGFETVKIIAFEESDKPIWYVVKNPRDIMRRVTLRNSWPVFLLVIAKRVTRRAIFGRTPQQSDYEALWKAKPIDSSPHRGPKQIPATSFPLRIAKMTLPFRVRRLIRRVLERPAPKPEGFDARFFDRMEWPAN